MNEQDRAIIRNFLASSTGQRWLEEARKSCPRLELGKYPVDAYNVSLYEKNGWERAIEWLENSATEINIPEFGVQPINTTID